MWTSMIRTILLCRLLNMTCRQLELTLRDQNRVQKVYPSERTIDIRMLPGSLLGENSAIFKATKMHYTAMFMNLCYMLSACVLFWAQCRYQLSGYKAGSIDAFLSTTPVLLPHNVRGYFSLRFLFIRECIFFRRRRPGPPIC